MSQLVTRLSDDLLAEVDDLVAEGVVASRSEAVRVGLQALVEQHRRSVVGRRIVDGYRGAPQTSDELAGLDEATKALVFEEPW
jgi:Arc/MetJ-type ribon-helix-helix transcriptional regulator